MSQIYNLSRGSWVPAVFCLLLSQQAAPLFGQADLGPDLEAIRIKWHMPGLSAMAVKQGHLIAQGAAGYRREGQPAPLLITDPVNIGSCTKWMTATLVGRLVDRGLLRWDLRVRDLFPNAHTFNEAFRDATLQQLLAHRAGVQQGTTFESRHWSQLMARKGSSKDIRRWVSETVLREEPEVTPGNYLYSNQGYTVVATMIELATGRDWEWLLQDQIFASLHMKSATIGQVSDDSIPPRAPMGHDLAEQETVAVPRPPMKSAAHFRYLASNAAGGAVACTLQDWVKFLRVHSSPGESHFVKPATLLHLRQPYSGAEGYGCGIVTANRDWATPGTALTHAGDIFGQNSVVWMAPARDFILVVFTNCHSADRSTEKALDEVAAMLVARYSNAKVSGPALESPVRILSSGH